MSSRGERERTADRAGPQPSYEELLARVAQLERQQEQQQIDRRQAEGALRESEAQFRDLYDNAPNAFFSVGVDGLVRRCNRRAAEMLGYTACELIGKRVFDLYAETPDGKEKAARVFARFRDGVPIRDESLQMQRADGELLWISLSVTPIRDAEGQVVESRSVVVDITDRKRAEQELSRSAALLEAVFAAMTDGLTVYDTDARIVRVNQAARSIYSADPVGKDLMSLARSLMSQWLDGRPLVRDELPTVRALRGERVTGARFTLKNVAGEDIIVESSSLPLRMGDEVVGAVTAWHEITELVRAQEALLQADQRKNEFLAVLSHELRNPLTPIKNSLHILERAAPGGDQAQRAFAVIDRQVGQLVHLVDDLLDITRITRNKLRLQPQRIELNDLVRRTLEDHRSLFEKSALRLDLELAQAPLLVSADWNRMAQVIGNLLTNAAKFTPAGGRVVVVVGSDTAAGRAFIRVTDTGAGMDGETLGRLFQPFAQADTTLDRSRGGLGLGLALVKGLVELHGGQISARSEGPGRGAELVVSLPIEEGTAPVDSERIEGAPPHGRRVLIIEDNVDAAESLREVLELGHHEVAVAYSGPEGVAKARELRPEVVLCDIGLPGMDGYEVARALRADEGLRATRLVALSGYALPEDIQRATEAGFECHLSKPPSLQKLEELLAETPSPGGAWPAAAAGAPAG